MKRITYLLALLPVFCAVTEAKGQYVVTREAVVVENSRGDKVVDISSVDSDRMTVQVAGIKVVLGPESRTPPVPAATSPAVAVPAAPKDKRMARPGHIGFMEVGINMLPAPDYSGYGDRSFLDLRHAASLQWAFSIPGISFKLDREGWLSISTGLQLIWNNYVFTNPVTLAKEDGRVVPVAVDNPKKTKISSFGLQIPVLLELNLPNRVFVAGGLYVGANLGTNTKVKFPKEKMRDPYMNPFYAGLTGRVGYGSFYVYANYGLSRLFQKDKGPAVSPLTIGIGIGF